MPFNVSANSYMPSAYSCRICNMLANELFHAAFFSLFSMHTRRGHIPNITPDFTEFDLERHLIFVSYGLVPLFSTDNREPAY